MKTHRTKLVVAVSMLVGFAVYPILLSAGSLEPDGPPAPTMKTLDEIYEAVQAAGVVEREGYLEIISIPADSNVPLFTVPIGKRFVLRKYKFITGGVKFYVDDNIFMDNSYFESYAMYSYDLPDHCAIVNSGETLRLISTNHDPITVPIAGYFYDVP